MLTKLIYPGYDESISNRINLYSKISKLPLSIIKHSSTSSVSSYLGIENNKIIILVGLAHAGTGAALLPRRRGSCTLATAPEPGSWPLRSPSCLGNGRCPRASTSQEAAGLGARLSPLAAQWVTPQVTAAPQGLYIANKPSTPSGKYCSNAANHGWWFGSHPPPPFYNCRKTVVAQPFSTSFPSLPGLCQDSVFKKQETF